MQWRSLIGFLGMILVIGTVNPIFAAQPSESQLANQSVDEFKALVDKRCDHFQGKTPKRTQCLKSTAQYWLDNDGKRYANLDPTLITGNDIAKTFLELKSAPPAKPTYIYLLDVMLWAITILIAASSSWLVRRNTLAAIGITNQSVTTAMLLGVTVLVFALFQFNPFHLLWIVPVAFLIGTFSLFPPLSLLWFPAKFYGYLCCVGLDKNLIEYNRQRANYGHELLAKGHSREDAIKLALEKYPPR